MVRKINSYYSHDRVSGIEFTQPSMAQQQFKEESDLNNIVDHNMRYKDPAFITKLQLQGRTSQVKPMYGDFTTVKDFQTSLEVIKLANEQFSLLPSKVRDRFENNPANMLAFIEDPKNYDEGVSLGIFQKPIVDEKTTSQEAGSKLDAEPISTNV